MFLHHGKLTRNMRGAKKQQTNESRFDGDRKISVIRFVLEKKNWIDAILFYREKRGLELRTELSFHDQFTLVTLSVCLSITHTATTHFCLCLMIKVHISFGVSLKNTEIARHKTIKCSPHHFPLTNFIYWMFPFNFPMLYKITFRRIAIAICNIYFFIGYNVNIYPISDNAETCCINSVYMKYEAFYLWIWHRKQHTQNISIDMNDCIMSDEWTRERKRMANKCEAQKAYDTYMAIWINSAKTKFHELVDAIATTPIISSGNEFSIMNIWILFWIFFVSFTFTNHACSMHFDTNMDAICNLNVKFNGSWVGSCFLFMKAKCIETSSRLLNSVIWYGTDRSPHENKGGKNGNRINCIDTHWEVKLRNAYAYCRLQTADCIPIFTLCIYWIYW